MVNITVEHRMALIVGHPYKIFFKIVKHFTAIWYTRALLTGAPDNETPSA
jgi:hypothetical protein